MFDNIKRNFDKVVKNIWGNGNDIGGFNAVKLPDDMSGTKFDGTLNKALITNFFNISKNRQDMIEQFEDLQDFYFVQLMIEAITNEVFTTDETGEIFSVYLKNSNGDKDESLTALANDFKKEFMDLEPQMVGQNIKINHLNDRIGMDGLPIKGASANSVAAIYYNKYIKDNNLKSFEYIKQGDKMRYVYLEQHNPFNTHIFGYLGDSLPDAVSKYELIFPSLV